MPHSNDSSSSLIEQGQLALKAMQLRKKVAEYESMAAELESAIRQAEHGKPAELNAWIRQQEGQGRTDRAETYAEENADENTELPVGFHSSIEFDANRASSHPTGGRPSQDGLTKSDLAKSGQAKSGQASDRQPGPWETMLKASEDRTNRLAKYWPNAASHPQNDPSLGAATNKTTPKSPSSGAATSTSPIAIKTLDKHATTPDGPRTVAKIDQPTKTNLATSKLATTELATKPSRQSSQKPSQKSSQKSSQKASQKASQTRSPVHSANATQLAALAAKPIPEVDTSEMTAWQRVRFLIVAKSAVLLSSWFLSLVAHALLAVLLVVIVVNVADPSPTVSITASSVPSEEIVLETPLEEPTEMTSDMTEITTPETPMLTAMADSDLTTPTMTSELSESLSGTFSSATESITGGAIGDLLGTSMSSEQLSGANFFGVAAEGNTFVYIVDSSGSMRRDNAFLAAKTELMRSIASLKETQRYYVIFFDKDLDRLTLGSGEPENYPVHATPDNIQQTAAWVQRVQIDGGGPPRDAFEAAIDLEPDAIFLLFDGETSADVTGHLEDVNRVTDLINGTQPRIPIHTLCFYSRDDEALMKRIAKENNGSYRYIPNPNRAN
jgi:hypothetical protein